MPLPDRRQTLPVTANRRSVLCADQVSAQIGGDQPGRGVLPVVQRALRHLGDEPLPGLPGDRVESGGGGVLRVRAHADDVREVQRVVVAPLLGGAEVAAVARLEPGDAVGQQRLEFVGPFQRLVGRAARGQPLVDERQRRQRAGDELGQVAVMAERAAGEPDEGVVCRRRRAGCPTAAAAPLRCDATRRGRPAGPASGRTPAGRAARPAGRPAR